MTDKYERQAKKARRQRRKQRSCTFKVRHETESDARKVAQVARGGGVYRCRNCGGWHVFGAPLDKVRRVPKRRSNR